MAILRTITVVVSSIDVVTVTRSGTTDGYAGEHLATRLDVTVPAAWDTYNAYVTMEAANGWQDESGAFLIGNPSALSFEYDLPQAVMVRGPLKICITAKKTVGGETQVARSAPFTLSIAYDPNAESTSATTFNDAINDLQDRVSSLEGGSATTNGVAATGVLIDNKIVRGDGGVRNVQGSGITIDDIGNLAGSASISMGTNIVSVGRTQGATGRFGNVAGGNYSDFESDGTLKLVGDATVYKDLIVSGVSTRVGGTAPTFAAFKGNVYQYSFSASAQNEVHSSVELQHDYMEGTDIEVHVHWAQSGTDNKNIVWGVEYTIANMETGVFGNTVALEAVDAAAGVALTHQYLSLGTIAGAGRKIGDVIAFMAYRKAAAGTDTLTDTAFLLEIGFHYKCDTIGSRSTTVK
jgi:hypothetical protein